MGALNRPGRVSSNRLTDRTGVEQVLFKSTLVTIGRFRLRIGHTEFASFGTITQHCFVFPRRSVWIRRPDQAPFVGDPTRVTMYNPGAEYRREPLDPVGDFSDWFGVHDGVLRDALVQYDPPASQQDVKLFRHSHAPVGPDVYLRQRRVYEYARLLKDAEVLCVEEAVIGLLGDVLSEVAAATARSADRRRQQKSRRQPARC